MTFPSISICSQILTCITCAAVCSFVVLLICVIILCDRLPATSQIESDIAELYGKFASGLKLPPRTSGALSSQYKKLRNVTSANSGGVFPEENQLCVVVASHLEAVSGCGAVGSPEIDLSLTPLNGELWNPFDIESWLIDQVNSDQATDYTRDYVLERLFDDRDLLEDVPTTTRARIFWSRNIN